MHVNVLKNLKSKGMICQKMPFSLLTIYNDPNLNIHFHAVNIIFWQYRKANIAQIFNFQHFLGAKITILTNL